MVSGTAGAIIAQVPTLVAVRIFKESIGVARGRKRKVRRKKVKKKMKKKTKRRRR